MKTLLTLTQALLSMVSMASAQSIANWTRQIPRDFPTARYGQAMAYDSAHGQVVLFGGYGSSGLLNDTHSMKP